MPWSSGAPNDAADMQLLSNVRNLIKCEKYSNFGIIDIQFIKRIKQFMGLNDLIFRLLESPTNLKTIQLQG